MSATTRVAEEAELLPSASIVIGTRGRRRGVLEAVSAAMAVADAAEVLVIDQNPDGLLDDDLDRFADDPRFRRLRSTSVGLARARNLALEVAESEIVCFADDDCIVPGDFVSSIVAQFASRPDLAALYCAVDGPTESDDEYTPYHRVERETIWTQWDHPAAVDRLGIGAGMAVRVSSAKAVGGFDPFMGPGGLFPSADDREISVRLLLRGQTVASVPEPVVTHLGSRRGAELRALTKRDHLGIGAIFGKVVRVHPTKAIMHLGYFLFHSSATIARDSIRLRRPAGVGKIVWTLVGVARGLRHPIDRDRLVYVDRTDGERLAVETARDSQT